MSVCPKQICLIKRFIFHYFLIFLKYYLNNHTYVCEFTRSWAFTSSLGAKDPIILNPHPHTPPLSSSHHPLIFYPSFTPFSPSIWSLSSFFPPPLSSFPHWAPLLILLLLFFTSPLTHLLRSPILSFLFSL